MSRQSHRLRLLLLSVAVLLVLPASGALGQTRHKLTQAGFRVLYMAPAFIALEKGFFTQEGVDFTFTELDSGALGAAAVISGNAQISDLDPLGVARLQQEGKPLLLVYNLVGRVTLDLIVRTRGRATARADRRDAPGRALRGPEGPDHRHHPARRPHRRLRPLLPGARGPQS